eukprot:347093_1
MNHNQQEEKYQQLELHIRSSEQHSPVHNGEEDILLHTKYAIHSNNDYTNEFPLQYAEYTLNENKDKIVVNLYNHDNNPIIHPKHSNTCCAIFKYRSEYMLNHRKQRYNIMFIPMYIMFIILCIYIGVSIHERINANISYINNPIHMKVRQNVTESEKESLKMCDIQFADINGWFDGQSFDFIGEQWLDYSDNNNNINS